MISINAVSLICYINVIISIKVQEIRTTHIKHELNNEIRYSEIGAVILDTTNAYVYSKGTYQYNEKRKVHNGLCKNIFPDLVVVPKSTEDVSKIIKIANRYNVPISVRSGGHSYTCTNIKKEGIHLDLRSLNKIQLTDRFPFQPPGPALILGPGSTWDRVLKHIPATKYTMIHGQCLTVGVGGYILGGGVNAIGTSQRYGSGALNVLEYTMVDAKGNIVKASENNVTLYNTESNRHEQVENSFGLYRSLQLAGSSFGVVTEFHYRIFQGPEILPSIALVYIEDRADLWKLQKAGLDGRYSISMHISMWFTPIDLFDKEMRSRTIFRLLLKFLPKLQFRRASPVIIAIVENFPRKYQLKTNKEKAYKFLEDHGLRVAVKGKLSEMYQPSSLDYQDYESVYLSQEQITREGFRPIISANFMNITNIKSIDHLLMHHPLFGIHNYGTRLAAKQGCEYCFLAIVISSQNVFEKLPTFSEFRFTPFEEIQPNDVGNFQVELSCLYKPNINSKCPRVVRNAKRLIDKAAIHSGERLTQYYNTPSCDSKLKKFNQRYWSEKNNILLQSAKQHWDPKNIFHHCHSVGSKIENCCPPDA